MKQLKPFLPFLIGFAMFATVLGIFGQQAGNVEAAPPAIPTPISASMSADNTGTVIKFWPDNTALTASGASTAFQLGQAELLDIQYVIDQATATNTITLTLQYSNDNSNWTNGVNVVAANSADVTNLLQFNNFGNWTRLYATLANTNPVTVANSSTLPRR